MEGGALSEADDSTNQTIQEESLTPERANTPEFPPPPTATINLQNETINSNLNETITLIDSRNDSINNTIKPTFKNIQQAKKRLHAFSVQKLNQLPTSPLAKKVRLDEKIEDTAKKTPKKHKDPNEKAKAVIEEIEEIKRNEQAYLESVRASIDKEHFKKIEKKSRNIRKRSPSIEKFNKNTTITTTTYNNSNDNISNKEKKRYPKNWNELHRLELSFDELNREFDIPPAKGNNDVSRQLLFELPSLPILETKMKTLNREDRLVPFQYVRFTKCKPIISFSINFNTFKEKYPNRRTVFETVPKEMAANIEKLYSSSLKFKTDYNLKVRNWFPKSWIDYNSECKLLENSVGLSFLQSYTEDDNEPTTSININKDIFNKNESSSNINNKNKDKKVVKKMKKKKKKKKRKKEASDKRKRTETKKKQKKSKIKEKLKKQKRAKAEKHHRCDDKIEQNDDDDDDNDRNSIRVEKIDEILEMKENTQNEVNVEDVGINKDKNNEDDDDEEEEERRVKTTPDTEDYHSHWESDDDLTKIKPTRPSIKLNRSWESDEELFERSGNNDNNNNNKRKQCDYNNLEIPLNLTNLITRKSINIVNDKKEEISENNCKIEILKPVNLNLDLDIIKTDNNNVSINLENQYEEFIKAVSTDSSSLNQQQHDNNDDNKELIVNNISNNNNNNDDDGDSCSSDTSTSSSSSPTTASSTSTSSDSSSTNNNNNNPNNNNSKKKKKKKYKLKKTKRKRNKIQDIFNEFDIPVPSDLPDAGGGGNSNNNNVLPLPVPSPDQTLLTITTNNEGVDLKKPFIFPTITIQSKKPLIDHSKLKLNDDSDSCDFTEKFLKKSNEIIPEEDVSVKSTITTIENQDNTKKMNKDKNNRNNKREQRNRDRDCKQKNSTKKSVRRRYSSPLLRRYSPKRRRFSPLSPTLSLKQRRKSPPSLQLSRRRSVSPLSRYRRSPRRKRTPSPLSKTRPTSSITTTTTKRALSPINSPLDGFKRSVADSTISDDMLPQPSSTVDDYSQSPISSYNSSNNITTKFFDKCDDISSMMMDNDNKGVIVGRVISSGNNNSPKRLSLDDRINQVLGLEKIDNDNKQQQQQQIDNYHEYNNYQYDQQYYGQYTQNYTNYNLTPVQQQSQTTVNTSTKVVQVGNILQVVPTDEVPHNLIENKTPDTGQKIVQVGNMLQIVPAVIQPTTTIIDNSTTFATNITTTTTTTVETTPITPILNQDENNQQFDENLMKQKSLERKAERERRRLERSRRRKEKEKKRKEREKRRQLKLKLKTENMIKKALQLEAETLFDDDDDVENSTQWPPIQVVVSASTDTPNKGILLTGGFSKIDGKKSVQFADGIRPGEGTSPSGGEELSSPPPKTKRHKKIKLPKKMKKKKIKVKVKRVQQQQQQQQLQENGIEDVGSGGGDDDNDEEYENLPPPSPPPGSPPPHVFPSRVKEPTFNNINPYIVTNPAYVTTYPRQPIPPPPTQMVINRPPYMPGSFHPDLHQTHNSFVGTTNRGIPSHH